MFILRRISFHLIISGEAEGGKFAWRAINIPKQPPWNRGKCSNTKKWMKCKYVQIHLQFRNTIDIIHHRCGHNVNDESVAAIFRILIQTGLGNQKSPPASSFLIILNEAPNPKEKQKTYFSMGLLNSPVPTFIMHLTSKKNRKMFLFGTSRLLTCPIRDAAGKYEWKESVSALTLSFISKILYLENKSRGEEQQIQWVKILLSTIPVFELSWSSKYIQFSRSLPLDPFCSFETKLCRKLAPPLPEAEPVFILANEIF